MKNQPGTCNDRNSNDDTMFAVRRECTRTRLPRTAPRSKNSSKIGATITAFSAANVGWRVNSGWLRMTRGTMAVEAMTRPIPRPHATALFQFDTLSTSPTARPDKRISHRAGRIHTINFAKVQNAKPPRLVCGHVNRESSTYTFSVHATTQVRMSRAKVMYVCRAMDIEMSGLIEIDPRGVQRASVKRAHETDIGCKLLDERLRNIAGDGGLDRQPVADRTIVGPRPPVSFAGRLDQSCRNAHA